MSTTFCTLEDSSTFDFLRFNVLSREAFHHYKVGNEHTDEEHWWLCKHLDMLSKISDPEDAVKLVDVIWEEWIVHAHNEEMYMSSIGYPYLPAHQDEHMAVQRQFGKLREKVYSQVSAFSVKLLCEHLEEVVVSHIDHWDQQYANWKKGK